MFLPAVVFSLFFVSTLMVVALMVLLTAMWLNAAANRRPEAVEFAKGQLPDAMPDGFWRGDRHAAFRRWQGKRFDAKVGRGVNVFTNGDRYDFKLITGPGLTNKALKVLKIDYNRPGNPTVFKPIVDEVVQVGPGKLLGKIQLRLSRKEALTLGYFRLSHAPQEDPA